MPAQTTLESRAAASSQKIEEVLDLIGDGALREDVAKVVRLTFEALANLRRIHLPQDHFEENESASVGEGNMHLELAPYLLGALSSINQLIAFVAEKFPAPAGFGAEQSDDEFDLEFDLVDGPTGDGVGLSHREATVATLTPREQVADALFAFGGMLRGRVLEFAQRLRHALRQQNSWALLAELDDTQHRITKAVQAVLFGVLGVFAKEVRREEILPAYRSAAAEAVALRTAVSELSFHINRFNAALGDATAEQAVPLVVAVADRLARFSSRPEYRTLRAEDKKAVIDFRAVLHDLRHRKEGLPLVPLRRAVEGFSKFLDAMHAINHREVLILHDRQRVGEALARLDELLSAQPMDEAIIAEALSEVIEGLDVLTGRNVELDGARREFMQSTPDVVSLETVASWKRMLEAVLQSVA